MTDYSVFARPDFDANDYANAILAGESYPSQPGKATVGTSKSTALEPAREDISVAISKLNLGIDDVSKQIKNVVTNHHEQLLEQATSVNDLSGSLTSVRRGLSELDTSLEKLRLKIRVPYQSLQAHVTRLQRLQEASDILRRTSRFVVLARRLEIQMSEMAKFDGDTEASYSSTNQSIDLNGSTLGADSLTALDHETEKERTIAKAALSVAELVALLDSSVGASNNVSEGKWSNLDRVPISDTDIHGNVSLRSVDAVADRVLFIEDARTKVTTEMEHMVLAGLTSLNQSMLASSLQTAYNLRVLPRLVNSLVLDLSDAVEDRIRSAFDLSRISKEVVAKDSPSQSLMYKSRVRTEPTNITAPQWTAALWSRLDTLIEELTSCCIKVYTLERVLKLKKDAASQTVFLDEAMEMLENKPSATFWTSLSRALEKYARDAAKGSTFLQQTLSAGYPKLLRLFHEFFAKIAVHTDTVYTSTYQSPETVLVLRALSNFEALYLSRSSNKLNEAVGQAFAGGARAPPGMNEGINIARAVANELDSARFDPLLTLSVAKNALSSLDMFLSRTDGLISRDRSAVTLVGPTATPQQVVNGQVATCLYHCWSRLEKLEGEHAENTYGIIKKSVESIHDAFERMANPLLVSIRRELGAIIARLHRLDFRKSVDPMAGMAGPSLYMKDLVEKLSYIKMEILPQYNIPEAVKTWVVSIVKFVIRTFVLHASIAKPLGESGKLQLTSDMTELEFALSAFLVGNQQSKRGGNLESVGDEYKSLRAMRPLLFLDNAMLTSAERTAGLPRLVVLHHILVRSPIPLPHTLHGWQEAEYVRWVDEHSEEEAWTLVESGLSHWEKMREIEDLAQAVLSNIKRIS
ncbi:hypothetical protein SERLADRAFT_448348 [Serpula lacrymans var. lacrymans S7.9]|uniref:Conserved oligomeric Golgi complex subunit 5 n=1 Tax=Serpula lacrymans var. lacrymans (strain S7.9) TaxID=578457 RepID=F8NVF9_SERL9|nr:uncharacterized protein SERLADRAFT_448348 [Serpula lacrymans var. lacrymans S7.9]EGO25368.1 hypothetical protein SERLADRAFT_448348 [Serpula lacrymans var. lacrymans S7.9]